MLELDVKVYTAEKNLYNRIKIPSEWRNLDGKDTKESWNSKEKSPICVLNMNGVQAHELIEEVTRCSQCRRLLLTYLTQLVSKFSQSEASFSVIRLRIILKPLSQCPDTIDYNWNERVSLMLRERRELDHALSWLSTLGGAFSALGDYFASCAITAAKISAHQFQLAMRMGDPSVAARCRLYFALSLIQRKDFRLAKTIVWTEYQRAKVAIVLDDRLLKMCQGIWAKLKYEWDLNKNDKRNNAIL